MAQADVPSGPYEANKSFQMGGRAYEPGDPVDVSLLPDHKVGQFLDQRILRPVRTDLGTTKRQPALT